VETTGDLFVRQPVARIKQKRRAVAGGDELQLTFGPPEIDQRVAGRFD